MYTNVQFVDFRARLRLWGTNTGHYNKGRQLLFESMVIHITDPGLVETTKHRLASLVQEPESPSPRSVQEPVRTPFGKDIYLYIIQDCN